MKPFYNWLYRTGRAHWDIGPRKELVEAVESGRIQPCRAIDLGCGTASNAIFLAQHGFAVTGTDYTRAAIWSTSTKERVTSMLHRIFELLRRNPT